jgi:peptide/nickel transport system substrate-binding protein
MTAERTAHAIVAAALLSLASVAAVAQTLKVAIEAEPEGLDPLLHHHAPGKLVVQHVGESLVGYRSDLSIAPALAERIDVSADARTYRFRVRDGAKFHNGAAVTAADVAWVFSSYYLDPKRKWECLPFYDGTGTTEERTAGVRVRSVRAVDRRTVEFRLEEPSSLFLHRLADTSCVPLVFHRASLGPDGKLRELIGTGPFRMGEWRRGDRLRLERFEQYRPGTGNRDGYGGAREPLVEAIEFVVVPKADWVAALEARRVHVLPDVDYGQYVAARETKGVEAVVTPLTSWYDLLIQTRDPVLSDKRVRQAIAHAIDLDYVAAVVTQGRGKGNPSVIPTGAEFHTKVHDERSALDPARARELLREASYNGQAITLQTSRDAFPWLYDAAVAVGSMLRAVGLNVQLQVIPWKEQLDTHYRGGSFQLSLFLFGGRNSPTLAYGKFIGPKAELARFQWDDSEAFALVREAEDATTVEALQAAYDALHRRMVDDVPTLPLFNDERFDLIAANVRGYEPTRFMRVPLWGVSLEP